MKIPRSEAVDKSPGVFFDAEYDFNGPRTPGAPQNYHIHREWANWVERPGEYSFFIRADRHTHQNVEENFV